MTSPYPTRPSSSSSHRPIAGSAATHDRGNATTSTSGSTSALRPRNRRLAATELSPGPGTKGGTSGNRDASPIPSRHPSRIVGAKGVADGRRPMGGLLDLGQEGVAATSPIVGFGKGIWEGGWTGSWSALQGLASSVLGENVDEDGARREGGKGGDLVRKRPRASSGVKKAPATWGPSGLEKEEGSIGAGSLAARDSVVKALKTASVLESHDGLNGLDVNGNYKRRISAEQPTSGRYDEEDSLVYVHHVTPQDTQAGIVLKYNCQPTVFRKANRFLPTDVPQMRKVVFLPVDACAIKGRPCDPPSEDGSIDLLAPTPSMEDPPNINATYSNGGAWSSPPHEVPGKDTTTAEQDGRSWIHVRWVLFDSSPSVKPVEIARLPRKSLGYFPPRRRKSQSTFSPASTPRSSFQISQEPSASGSGSGTPTRGGNDLGHAPARNSGGYFPPQQMNSNPISRTRRDSSAHRSAAPALPKWLTGPGGVGSLSKEVRAPGPAEDSFNTWAEKHMPMLSTRDLPSSSAIGGAETKLPLGFQKVDSIGESQTLRSFPTAAGSGTVTPSGSGVNLGLENAASAIEGWVRRLAVKAHAPGTPKMGGINAMAMGMPEFAEGDLIELLDGAGSDDGGGLDGRSRSNERSGFESSGSGREDAAARAGGRIPTSATLSASGKGKDKGKGKSD